MLFLLIMVLAVMVATAAVRAALRMRDPEYRPDSAALWGGVLAAAGKGTEGASRSPGDSRKG